MPSRLARREIQEAQRAQKTLAQMSTAACTILLCRHGETSYNIERRLQGQTIPGPPLTEKGHAQAQALADGLKIYRPINALYSSDLYRAVETAHIVAGALSFPETKVKLLPGLRERSLGVLQGVLRDEGRALHPEAYRIISTHDRSTPVPGGGESLDQLVERVTRTIEYIANKHPGEVVATISHGGALHAAFRRAVGRAHDGIMPNCAINVLRIDPTQKPSMWVAVDWGVVEHLHDLTDANGFGGGASGG